MNGNCIKFGGDDLRNGGHHDRDVKDGRQFEKDILLNSRESRYHHYPPLDTAETVSIQSELQQKV